MPDQPMQRGPHSYHMDAPSDVTTWTVIQTTRNVVTDDRRDMTLRDEWWEVPSFVVEAIDHDTKAALDAALARERRLREALAYAQRWLEAHDVDLGPVNAALAETPEAG